MVLMTNGTASRGFRQLRVELERAVDVERMNDVGLWHGGVVEPCRDVQTSFASRAIVHLPLDRVATRLRQKIDPRDEAHGLPIPGVSVRRHEELNRRRRPSG